MSARTDVEAQQNATVQGVSEASLKARIQTELEAEHVEIEDLSGGHALGCFHALQLC